MLMDENICHKLAFLFLALQKIRESICEAAPRLPLRTGKETGHVFIMRVIYGNPNLCQEQLHIERDAFIHLSTIFGERNLLCSTYRVTIFEQVGIMLYILTGGGNYRRAADKFQHSLATISKYFKLGLVALSILSCDYIKPYMSLTEIPNSIRSKRKFWPFFKDCIGAIDGTHITACIGGEEGIPFRGRKQFCSWNVMAICSFDMIFTFINAGWEGSAHDMRVFKHCLSTAEINFPHPPIGKYYVVDSGYPNTTCYLAPFLSTKYHIPEFHNGPWARGKEELFNYHHSSLRNVIERCFGQLKKKFPILYEMPVMDPQYQIFIIVATMTLHNLIKMHKLGIQPYNGYPYEVGRVDNTLLDRSRTETMRRFRDTIADEIYATFGNEGVRS